VDEYLHLSLPFRIRERIYRRVLGFGVYYLLERWWKDKLFPRSETPAAKRRFAWFDLLLIALWLVSLAIVCIWLDSLAGRSSPSTAIAWGILFPFLVWNALMGATAFLQHTNPRIPWYRTIDELKSAHGRSELAVCIRAPHWYDLLSHNIMHHPAHHLNPRIPWYRLAEAQQILEAHRGADSVTEKIDLGYISSLTRICQLYDYERHVWITFEAAEADASNYSRNSRSARPN
jgi:omega-6 fatty acid desaturase (delta-12 desaturase)